MYKVLKLYRPIACFYHVPRTVYMYQSKRRTQYRSEKSKDCDLDIMLSDYVHIRALKLALSYLVPKWKARTVQIWVISGLWFRHNQVILLRNSGLADIPVNICMCSARIYSRLGYTIFFNWPVLYQTVGHGVES